MSDELYELVQRLVSSSPFTVAAIHAAIDVFEAPVGVWPGAPLAEEEIVRVLPSVVYGAHATAAGMTPAVLAVAFRQNAGIGQAKEAA